MKQMTLVILFTAITSFAQSQTTSPESTPWHPTDRENRTLLKMWTSMIDQMRDQAINEAKRRGRTADPMAEIEPFLKTLADNPYFDPDREAAIHPGYLTYLERVAAIRGKPFAHASFPFLVGELIGKLVPFLGIGLWFWFWCRRVARKSRVPAGASRGSFYARILAKMSWRVLLIVISGWLISVALMSLTNWNASEVGCTGVIVLFLLLITSVFAVLISSWRATRDKLKTA